MCTRYFLISPDHAVRAAFATSNGLEFPLRYNIAPSQPVTIVRHDHTHRREMALVRWGLIPAWTKEPGKISLFNARAETAEEKASFRGPMRHRRCLVPADGYYDWVGPPGGRRRFLLRPADPGPIAFAGLWEHWLGADGSEIETMAILTVPARPPAAPVGDRMPVILAARDHETWLDVRSGRSAEAAALLVPPPAGLLQCLEISPAVDNPRNDGPHLHAPEPG